MQLVERNGKYWQNMFSASSGRVARSAKSVSVIPENTASRFPELI